MSVHLLSPADRRENGKGLNATTKAGQKTLPEESWPWFSGKMENLSWFRQAWEDHVTQFFPGLPERTLIERMHRLLNNHKHREDHRRGQELGGSMVALGNALR
jgi:hypothetical protein